MRRAVPLVLLALAAAGCGGGGTRTVVVRQTLPRSLASTWSAQADAVAAALASGDGCTARTTAVALRTSVIAAVQSGSVRPAFQETLLSAVNDLPDRIACHPAPAPTPRPPAPHDHPKGPKPPHGHAKGHKP
ncbi:MAG: hypothetical protein ABUS54_06390 [Actinomycetota bacterium]